MKILIAYDGSGYSHTALDDLQHAGLPSEADVFVISIAEEWLSPKTNGTSYHPAQDYDVRVYFQQHADQMNRNLAETEAILGEAKQKLQRNFPKWKVRTEAITGSPAQLILKRAAEFKPDLIVVGAQGLSFDGLSGIGSISQKIISESPFPVRIVRGNLESGAARFKIDICYDGSPASMEAIRAVASRYWRVQPEIRILVVIDPLIALIPGRVFRVIEDLPEGKTKGETKWIETFTRKAIQILETAGLSASIHVYSGNPRIVLPAESKKWKSDTIFIGANSRQIQSQSLGCVASAIAARAFCSVEIISNA